MIAKPSPLSIIRIRIIGRRCQVIKLVGMMERDSISWPPGDDQITILTAHNLNAPLYYALAQVSLFFFVIELVLKNCFSGELVTE